MSTSSADPLDAAADLPSLAQVWEWLADVPDPEIPVVSVVDLGIVRTVLWSDERPGVCLITVTPTYSGCPATDVIGGQIVEALRSHGVSVELRVQLSPAWTTDWLTDEAKRKLREYGIAPPIAKAGLPGNSMAESLVVLGQGDQARTGGAQELHCPRCGSSETEMISRFGSTPCKSLHRCLACLEPFDHFKCH